MTDDAIARRGFLLGAGTAAAAGITLAAPARAQSGPVGRAADLVLQRAVVRTYSSTRHTTRTHRLTAGLTLPRRAFRPPPHVDSAVLLIRRR